MCFLDGFRKGHVPEGVLLKNIGEQVVTEDMAHRALQDEYTTIIKENKIDAIGQPEVTITKLAPGNPLGFKIKVAVMPDMTLPDYKKIAAKHNKKKETITVEDKEVDETIAEIQKMHNKSVEKKTEGEDSTEKKEEKETPPPPLTDDFVKTLGDFKTVDDFKKKLRDIYPGK